MLLLHDESLAEHGGLSGLRDEGLLDSALARPENLAAFGEPDSADIATSHTEALAKNHPSVDGNKCAAFLAMGFVPFVNGYRLEATQADATVTMVAVAGGEIDEASLVAWIRQQCVERPRHK